MANIIVPSRRLQQPQGLYQPASDIDALVVPYLRCNWTLGKISPIFSEFSGTIATGKYGKRLLSSRAGAGLTYLAGTNIRVSTAFNTTSVTIFLYMQKIARAEAQNPGSIFGVGGSGNDFGINYNHSTALSYDFSFRSRLAYSNLFNITATLTNTVSPTLARIDFNQKKARILENGIVIASADYVGNFGNNGDTFPYFLTGASNYGYWPELYFGAFYNRELPDDYLVNDPWSVLKSRSKTLYFDAQIAETTTAPAGTQAPYLVLPSRRIDQINVKNKFKTSKGGIWVAKNNLYTKPGGHLVKAQSNPAYTGPSIVPSPKGLALRVYADHGGNDDDRYQFQEWVPTAKTSSYTSIIWFRALSVMSNNILFERGHYLSFDNAGSMWAGYDGGNGSTHLGLLSVSPMLDTDRCIIISTDYFNSGNAMTISIDGKSYAATYGPLSNVGNSNGSSGFNTWQPITGTYGYTNYYQFNGYIYLWGNLPGVYLTSEEANLITKNPELLFESTKSRSYFDYMSPVVPLTYASPLAIAGGELLQATSIPLNNLGSGTPDETKYLRGDGVWALPVTPADYANVLELNNLGGL